MFNIGSGEMVLIAVAALLLLGPKRLPELARGLGKFMREFRRQTDEVRNVVEREFYKMDKEMDAAPPEAPVPQLTAAADSVPLQPPLGQLTEAEDHQLLVPADPDPAVSHHLDPTPAHPEASSVPSSVPVNHPDPANLPAPEAAADSAAAVESAKKAG